MDLPDHCRDGAPDEFSEPVGILPCYKMKTDEQIALEVSAHLAALSPAGKIAIVVFLIQEVAKAVPGKPLPAILADLSKILASSAPQDQNEETVH